MYCINISHLESMSFRHEKEHCENVLVETPEGNFKRKKENWDSLVKSGTWHIKEKERVHKILTEEVFRHYFFEYFFSVPFSLSPLSASPMA